MQLAVEVKPGSKVYKPVFSQILLPSITQGPTLPFRTGNSTSLPFGSSNEQDSIVCGTLGIKEDFDLGLEMFS